MGKLFVGHYGQPPEAESIEIGLRDCHQRLGMKPSDFVSLEEPDFFRKKHGAMGKYLVFQVDATEIRETAVWRPGYYLLPLSVLEVVKAFKGSALPRVEANRRPVSIEAKQPPPEDVLARAHRWSERSQPLLFECHCPELVLKMDPPHLLRRHWKVRLTCRKRCQPAVNGLI